MKQYVCSHTEKKKKKTFMPSVLANSIDPDQTPQNEATDQGLHCLHGVQKFLFKGNNENNHTTS